jgi:hypothetical protein
MNASSHAGASAIAAMLAVIVLGAGAARAGDLRSSAQTSSLTEQHNLAILHPTVGVPSMAATSSVTAPQSFITTHPAHGQAVTTTPKAIEIRYHGPGSNISDPCLQTPGACDPRTTLKHQIADLKAHPPTAKPGDCLSPHNCLIEWVVFYDETGTKRSWELIFTPPNSSSHGAPDPISFQGLIDRLNLAAASYKGPTRVTVGLDLGSPPTYTPNGDHVRDHRQHAVGN